MLEGGRGFVTPTKTNVHGDAICFVVKTWARHITTETVLNNGGRLVVGGGWRLMAVRSGWRLALAVSHWWRLAVGGWRRFTVDGGSERMAVGVGG